MTTTTKINPYNKAKEVDQNDIEFESENNQLESNTLESNKSEWSTEEEKYSSNRNNDIVLVATRNNKRNNTKVRSPYNVKENLKEKKLTDNPVPFSTPAMRNTSLKSPSKPKDTEVVMDWREDENPVNVEESETKKTKDKESTIKRLTNGKEYQESNEKSFANECNKETKPSSERQDTEKLDYLDLSVINDKNIINAKKESRKERIQNIKNAKPQVIDQDIQEKTKRIEKHVRLMDGFESFNMDDLINNIASVEVTTKLVHLLDLFPKFRTAFSQKLKLTPNNSNAITNVITAISNHKIVKVKGRVEDTETEIFLDSCASMNMVSKSLLNQLRTIKEPIGSITETIFQAYSVANNTTDIYKLKLTIGEYQFEDNFRVIEDNNLFDILVGIESLKKNRFNLNFVKDKLYYIDHNNKETELAQLYYDIKLPGEENINTRKEEAVNPVFLTVTPDIVDQNNKEEGNSKSNIVANIIGNLPKTVKKMATDLFKRFVSVLAIKTDDLGLTKLLPHKIPLLPGTIPINQKAYRLSRIQLGALKKILTTLYKNKLIEPSCSSWSSPVVLVPKKDNDYRMCVDYRRLNQNTIKDAYALPRVDDILYSIGKNAKILSTLDLYSGYHQIPMYPPDMDKTCFTTPFGNYNFRVMPFGLCNAPATFQREMNRIFFDLIGKNIFIYIDDVVVFSETPEKHIEDLKEVFTILEKNGLKVNVEKCHFFREEVDLLGHRLTINGIKPIPSKVEVIMRWLPPKNVSELRSFMGAVSYYRKFISSFAMIAYPLFKLLKKGATFFMGEEGNQAFEKLKRKLIEAPILSLPDFKKGFLIRTDASRKGIGGVLMQLDEDGIEHPLHFISRTLSKTEGNYSVTDLEGLAAFYCIKKFKHYICSSKGETLLITDHKPLVGFFRKTEPTTSRHYKWINLMSSLKVVVKYEEGKRNSLADSLSRLETWKEENNKTLKENTIIMVTVTNEEQQKNVETTSYQGLNIEKFLKQKIIEIDGVQYYKCLDQLRRIIDKPQEQFELIQAAHEVGHDGVFKTYQRLKREYYWPGMKRHVKIFIKSCHRCQTCKNQPLNQNTEDLRTPPELPFTRIGLDIVGPLPKTKRNNRYILVVVEYLTQWVEAEAVQSIESDDVIRFLKAIFARHGIPELLVTDNGPQFISDKTKAFLDLHDVIVNNVTTYHPESNGKVENRNKEISKYLRVLGNRETNWDEILPSALWALRTCKSEVTGFSSFELLYGRQDLQPFELGLNVQGLDKDEGEEEYWLRKFIIHHKWITEAISNIETANKLWLDRRRQIKRLRAKYKPGDLILVKVFNRRKLDPYFTGPLRIVKRELNTVTVCDPVTGEIAERNIHLKNVIPYFTEVNVE